MRKAVLILMLFFSIISSFIGCAPPDPLTETVIKADLIVLGTITDNRTDVVTIVSDNSTGKRAYTLFTLSVEKVIKGNPDTKEVLIKVKGGPISSDVYQVPIEGYFSISDRLLAALHLEANNVYTIPSSGLVWCERPTIGARPLESLSDSIGRVIQTMIENNVPIALPRSEWPPLPVGPVSPPKN